MAIQSKDFSVSCKALGGRVTVSYILRVTEESVDTAKNCSLLTLQAILKQAYDGTAFHNFWTGVSCSIDDQSLFSDYRIRTLTGREEHVYHTWTGQIPHEDDGTCTIRISGRVWQPEMPGDAHLDMEITDGTMVLTPISRASGVGAEDAPIEGRTTVVISPVAEGFTHTLAYTFGEETGYIGQDGSTSDVPVQLTGNTVSFLIPESFYYQIPDRPWAECLLECKTYRQDQPRGSKITRFRVTADPARCSPTAELVLSDVNEATLALTGSKNRAVQYMSTLRCRPQVKAMFGARITECRINGKSLEGEYLDIPQAEKDWVTCRVTDSRGYISMVTATIPMIPYVKLTNNPQAVRTAPTTGCVSLTFSGNCYRGSFGAEDNVLSLRYRLCPEFGSFGPWQQVQALPEADHTYRLDLELTDVDYTKSYTLETEVFDRLDRVTAVLTVQQGIPVFHWKKDRFFFHVPVECDQSVSGAYIRSHPLYGQTEIALTIEPGQTVFLFSGCIWGTVQATGQWQGTENVTVRTEAEKVTLSLPYTASDEVLLISSRKFQVE
ncbi:MAG: hypothetical protein IJB02_02850 [Oscillospiraceae bacterium]|nr:hypothetical protein [Oscillospiraceae bacterium]